MKTRDYKLRKPESVARSEYQSRQWDLLVLDYKFKASDAPVLADLCLQMEIVAQATEYLTKKGNLQILWNDDGVPRARPEIAIIERANAQIAALKRQLGIYEREEKQEASISPLAEFRNNLKLAK